MLSWSARSYSLGSIICGFGGPPRGGVLNMGILFLMYIFLVMLFDALAPSDIYGVEVHQWLLKISHSEIAY